MSNINFTDSQRAAIETEAQKILISAAAGSGKSTVLTERIIRSITSNTKKFDISKILAVTFTKASAEDLRAKISKAINEAVLSEPKNKRLKGQLTKLASAKISTIHGLCYTLIKSHFQMLGLAASVRVLDDIEAAALRSEVLSELLESAYAGYFTPIRDFSAFAEKFISEEDKELEKMFMRIYDSIKNIPNGFAEWEKKIDSIPTDGNLQNTEYGSLMLFHLSLFVDCYMLIYNQILPSLSADSVYAENYLPAFSNDFEYLKNLKEAADKNDFIKATEIINSYVPEKLKGKSGYSTPEGEYAKEARDNFKKEITNFKKKYFNTASDELKTIGAATVNTAKAVINFLSEFDRRFSEEKKKRSVLDFNDLEHYALKLLYTEDGKYSEIAYRISDSLNEIYVDEYQDVNPLQNKIFEALSVSCPIFTVGDIKQSIYRFRGAKSEVFSDCRKSFAKYVPGTSVYPDNVQILLSENFRSANTVTEFVNAVTDPLFTTLNTEPYYSYRIPYSKEDRLVCKANVEDAPIVSILIADEKKPSPSAASEGTQTNDEAPQDASLSDVKNTASVDDDDNDDDDIKSIQLEAEMVASKIVSILSDKNNKTKPEDIAILLRNTKNDGAVFEAALKKRNVPVSTEKGASLFDAPEIQLSLCLLNCIDNPYRDIFLAGALRSPVFGFTLNDLIEIKRFKNGLASLFDALKEYAEYRREIDGCAFEKAEYFLKFLEKLRSFASQNSIDRTLWQIYTETHFFTLIYDGGAALGALPAARRANLLKLHGIAKTFVETGKGDLFSFIEHLRNMQEGTKPPSSAVQAGGVKIMTIHHSKGLEFEHCFLSRTARLFSTESHKSSVMLDDEYGIAMRINDELGLSAATTPLRNAIMLQDDLLSSEEEIRLLYVALSRAKKALYISGCVGGARQKDFPSIEKLCYNASKTPHPYLFFTQKCYLKWILTALKCKNDLAPYYSLSVFSPDEILSEAKRSVLSEKALNTVSPSTEGLKDASAILKERFEYVYPFKNASLIPSKISVSNLTPKILDSIEEDDNADVGKIPDLDVYVPNTDSFNTNGNLSEAKNEVQKSNASEKRDNAPKMKTPSFMLKDTKPTGAEKGTATHVFMQFCDFDVVEKKGIDTEIKRLVDKRFIQTSHAELIDKHAVNRFFSSSLYREMKKAASLTREYRFNIKLPASDFTAQKSLKEQLSGEFIFVQGVIDCYFRDTEGRIYLLDYKTDRIPKEILGNREKEDKFFADAYSEQLKYYEKALERLTGKTVYKKLIYSFALGRTVEIK